MIKVIAISSTIKIWLLFILSICEIGVFAVGKELFGIYGNPLLMTIIGLVMAMVILMPTNESQVSSKPLSMPGKAVLALLWLGGLLTICQRINKEFVAHPINHSDSDVLAQVLTPSKAILDGTDPYQMVKLPTYEMFNTYLPMMWSPFIVAQLWDIDARWIPFGLWAIIDSIILGLLLMKNTSRPLGLFSSLIVLLLAAWSYVNYYPYDFRVSLELVPISYYMLLLFFLLRGNHFGVGIMMGFCLLSRFTIILFIPFLVFYYWKMFGIKPLIKTSLMTVAVVMAFFVIPFMSKDSQLPFKIMANYNNGSAGEWRTHSWQNPGDEPHQLSRGLGLAIFAKKHYEWDVVHGVKRLRQVGVACSVAVSFILMIFINYFRKNRVDQDMLLGGLKLFFTVFYALVLIPYPYLFVLPLVMNGMFLLLFDLRPVT